jgi:hypothetical protein
MPQEGSGNVREILQYFGDYQLLQCILLHRMSSLQPDVGVTIGFAIS